jgi:REP element-mobilizing transposase RayT
MLGDAKSRLFVCQSDRERFIQSLSERVKQYNVRLYMYVLMNNHFHLVFETPEGNCSKFMHALSTSYTVYYNLRHNRHGHLFDGRFKSKLVDSDNYLLSLSRYVHLNPVKVMRNKPLDQRLSYLRQYSWSSYHGYINKRKRQDFVEYLPVLSAMPEKSEKYWSRNYKRFVEGGVAKDDHEFMEILKASAKSIGGEEFNKRIDLLYQKLVGSHESMENIAFRHTTDPVSVDVVLKTVADVFDMDPDSICKKNGNGLVRAITSVCLMRYSGKSQREISLILGVGSGSAISRNISRHKERLSSDKKTIKLQKKAERLLDEYR